MYVSTNLGAQGWTLYECLVAEVGDPNNPNVRHVLLAGDWYTAAASLVTQINLDLAAIPLHQAALPNANAGETEGDYNTRFAGLKTNTHGWLDAKTIGYGGGRSRIEVCDVLTSAGCMYHVEDYHGSATLSHLFGQGTVSGSPLLEQEFRQEFVNKHPNLQCAPIQPIAIDPGHMEVVYTIMCEQNRAIPQDLPFSARFAWVSRRGN